MNTITLQLILLACFIFLEPLLPEPGEEESPHLPPAPVSPGLVALGPDPTQELPVRGQLAPVVARALRTRRVRSLRPLLGDYIEHCSFGLVDR